MFEYYQIYNKYGCKGRNKRSIIKEIVIDIIYFLFFYLKKLLSIFYFFVIFLINILLKIIDVRDGCK